MKTLLVTTALLAGAATAKAAERYVLDPSHSQILFDYNHLGYSTTWGMFSGFEGEIMFDQENPEASSVSVSFPVRSMFTGWEQRFEHFMSEDFFGAGEDEMVTFESTSIEVTGENTAEITGDLTLNGETREVVLDAVLNQAGMNPLEEKEWAGFTATTTLLRSDYGLGMFAPMVGDEVNVTMSVEAARAEAQDS
jgi:polyisoprenoid-binding protein YceI